MYPPNQAFNMGGAKQVEIFLLAGGMALLAMAAFMLPMNKISRLFFLGQKVWFSYVSHPSIPRILAKVLLVLSRLFFV